jgi:hypothetical protein
VRVQADQVSAKARQYSKFAKAMSRVFDKYFFDGTGTAKDFKGINALIDDGLGQSQSAGTNGAALTLDMLDESFDALRSQSAPDALLMNRQMRRKINGLARSTYSGISLIDVGTDVFGRQVNTYNGVPIRIVGDDKDGNPILSQVQVQGNTSINTSIYAIAFGTDENVYGILGLGGSFDVKDFGETEAAPGHLGRVEVYPGVVVSNSFSVCRLVGAQE